MTPLRTTRHLWLAIAGGLGIMIVIGLMAFQILGRGSDTPIPPSPPPVAEAATEGPPPPAALVRQIRALGRSFDGRVGIVVRSISDGWSASFGGAGIFPQQSVSKLWVASAVLDQVDAGKMALNDPVTLTQRDLTIFHQPIRKRIGTGSYTTTIAELLSFAMTQSDNTANDVLFRRVGGQAGLQAFLVNKNLGEIAMGPGEKALQAQTAALTWDDRFSYGRTFWQVRESVPLRTRARALTTYVIDPPDGATPVGIARALARIKGGGLLSPASTAYLLTLMAQSKTGPDRLKGGLIDGWTMAHKTGTGQVLGTFATAYNDVGILSSPVGKDYAIVVMIGSTRRPVPERQALMGAVTRAVIACGAGC
ncbi:MAG: serine hydrolase [Sphingomonadaceae bacterium]